MARLLFTVEDTFLIKGRGLVLVPGIIPLRSERLQVNDPILLRRPDGSSLAWQIDALEILHGGSPDCIGTPIVVKALKKEDVPVGTEVWSVDAATQARGTAV